MTHDGAVDLLGDLLQDRLNETEKSDVLKHVFACGECRSLVQTYLTLSETFHGGEDEHPSSAALAQYAVKEAEMDEEERDRVASHVLACPTCMMELDAAQRGEAELDHEWEGPTDAAGGAPSSGERANLRAAIAAGIVFVALGYPAFVGLFEMPRIKERIELLEQGGPRATVDPIDSTWAGPVRLLFLTSPLRASGEEIPSVEVVSGQPYVSLAVDPALTGDSSGADEILFRIEDPAGQTTWSWQLPEDGIKHYMGNTGVVAFLVPAGDLPTGRLILNLERKTPDGPKLIFEAPFLVSRTP